MLPEATRPPRAPLGLLPEPAAVEDQTPFEMVSAEPGVLLACFQEVRHFSPGTRVRSGGWRPGRP